MSPWQTWRQRVLPLVKSVLETAGTSTTRPSRPRLLQDALGLQWRTIANVAGPIEQYGEGVSKEIAARKKEIDEAQIDPYPRYIQETPSFSFPSFKRDFASLKPEEKLTPDEVVSNSQVIEGRIHAIRTSGSKLVFLDLVQTDPNQGGSQKLQVLLNARLLSSDVATFRKTRHLLRRGDIISVSGYPHRTASGQLSLMATNLPQILSPCLHQFPVDKHTSLLATTARPASDERDSQPLDRHVELLTDPELVKTLRMRSEVLHNMRAFFRSEGFVEVQTPILAASAGGASARPFETTATEFSDRKLSLRIAPELWLKRLIIGGLEKVFEIGPCFRNEGLDKTHNPEFTSCEFYSTYTSLPQLLSLTERLLRTLALRMWKDHDPNTGVPDKPVSAIQSLDGQHFHGLEQEQLPQIDFIPALNAALGQSLPNLASPTATSDLVSIFLQKSLPLPAKPTLPRLLDKLSSIYLEPQCQNFTFIIHHPECMSPLSKSFIHPATANDQPVAARAELFVHGRELVNCYEEENSPFEQRRKFKMQQHYAKADLQQQQLERGEVDDEAMGIDEDYLHALEWGLPPTGGWGCGIDRLVMFFAGKDRIGDVLSFGNLRAVTRGREKGKSGEDM